MAEGQQGWNPTAANWASQAANDAARNVLARDSLDFEKAKWEWEKVFREKYAEFDASMKMIGMGADLIGKPQDWFKYLEAMSGTPEGLRGVVNAVAGRYNLPGYGGNAAKAVPGATIGGIAQDIVYGPGNVPGYTPPAQAPAPTAPAQPAQPPGQVGVPTPVGQPQPVPPPQAQAQAQAPGTDWLSAYQGPAQQAATAGATAGQPVGQTPAPSGYNPRGWEAQVPTADELIYPHQWAPQQYAKFNPGQKALLGATYNYRWNWQPEDITYDYMASLPKYRGPTSGVIRR